MTDRFQIELFMIIVTAFSLGIVIGTFCRHSAEPTALDVYQGKTTLKYIYQDGYVIDSVVIYKDNEHEKK